MNIEIKTLEACRELRDTWNALLSHDNPHIQTPGISMTYEWTESLAETRLKNELVHVYVARDKNEITAILPVYKKQKSRYLYQEKNLSQVAELYATRNGLIRKSTASSIDIISSVMERNDIASFKLTTCNPEDNVAITDHLNQTRTLYTSTQHIISAWKKLPEDRDDILNALEKKFRYTLRTSIKSLEQTGRLTFKTITHENECADFLSDVYEIERASWKEEAGTSITKNQYQQDFYNSFIPKSAKRGWLRGAIIYLDNEPFVHSINIVFNGVCECLKTSFKEKYKQYSPGHLIDYMVFLDLHDNKLMLFDFLGIIEPSKRKWTKDSYIQTQYTIYSSSITGKLASTYSVLEKYRVEKTRSFT